MELRVVVRVDVDESGCDEQPVGVDRARRVLGDRADLGDVAVAYADVGRACGRARAVDDGAALDEQVKHGPASAYATDGCGMP